MTRLLILGCSSAKTNDPGLIPAIERYDGPSYRIVRKYLREGGIGLDIWILSARYGLIPAIHPIANYDRIMTIEIGRILLDQIEEQIGVMTNGHLEGFLVAGRTYVQVFMMAKPRFPDGFRLTVPTGGIFKTNVALSQWLRRI